MLGPDLGNTAMLSLKLRAVGTSTGVVLPKEMLARLHAGQGTVLYAVESPSGYTLTTLDPEVKKQVESGEAFMDRYRDVFAALAK
jgi:putative addiction module antidote